MPKKSNPEKGLRTVSLDFAGKTRTLKFSHATRGNFEAEANQVLRAQGVITEGMIFSDALIAGWLGNAKIMSLALKYALVGDDPSMSIDIIEGKPAVFNPDGSIKDAATVGTIDSFIEAGGKEQDLFRAVVTAYRYATDPSSVASLMRSWQISDDRLKFQTTAENKYWDEVEKAIADAKAKQIDGMKPTDSPSSNSASVPDS